MPGNTRPTTDREKQVEQMLAIWCEEAIELEVMCPSDSCPDYDVDFPGGGLPRVHRRTWLASGVSYTEIDWEPDDPASLLCPACGTPGQYD